MSTNRAERPTTLPERTWNTWTAASSSSSARPKHVEVLGTVELHLADGVGRPHRLELVPEHRGPLELEGAGGLLHGRLEPSLERAGVPAQEGDEVGHHPVVLVVVHGPDARARAPLDVVQQAGPAQALVAP